MIEQLSDSGFTGGGVVDGSLSSNDKQQPVVVKKQALRDLPNENNVHATKSVDDSTLQKERLPVKDTDKVSGTKRLSSEVNPPPSQVSSAVNTNGNLVYVRRKTEAEVGKIPSGIAGNNTDVQHTVKAPVSNERVQPSPSLTLNKAEVGKSSSGVAGNNTDVQLTVRAPVSNERVQPSPTLSKPQIDAGNISRSSEPPPNAPAVPINFRKESPVPDPLKSGTIMPSSKGTSSLPDPAGKSGNTVPSSENKAPLPHPVGISGNAMSPVENKSPHPHPTGVSVSSISSTVNKAPLHPLGTSSNTASATEDKSPASHPLGNSDATASVEIRSQLPRPVGYSGVINSSVENRAPVTSLGMSAYIRSSAENNHIPPASVTTKKDFTKESNSKLWQRWPSQSRVSLRGLDQTAHEEYQQMLRSLTSVELSRLAFELETRSIQLSLEEAREMARVEMLNVMGKSSKPFKSPIALPEK